MQSIMGTAEPQGLGHHSQVGAVWSLVDLCTPRTCRPQHRALLANTPLRCDTQIRCCPPRRWRARGPSPPRCVLHACRGGHNHWAGLGGRSQSRWLPVLVASQVRMVPSTLPSLRPYLPISSCQPERHTLAFAGGAFDNAWDIFGWHNWGRGATGI